MKYLCLVHNEEKKLNALSKSGRGAFSDEHLGYTETLRKTGHLSAAEALEPVQIATIVRERTGKVSVTDGPIA